MTKQISGRKIISMFKRSPSVALALIITVMVVSGVGSKLVHAVSCSSAASCQAQINSLNNQNAASKATLNNLKSQAQSYQGTIDSLTSQIASVQADISANEAKQASLEQKIAANELEIAQKKSTLSDDIKTMYVDGQMTTIEELATSQSLSDFVDKQEYQSVVQDQLSAIIQSINTLQQQLQAQKAQVAGLVATEQAQNSQLASAEAQQQQLLGYDQTQQAAYNNQIAADNSNISALQSQLTALNNAGSSTIDLSSTCGGGYPTSTISTISGAHWGCGWPQDNTVDNWYMDNRECVSYTAFMASTHYGVSANGWGNAYQWIGSAESAGYTVDQTPSVGAIAIRDRDYGVAGDVGHAMYVVAVNGPDSITVDEYNEHYNGTFDERTFSPSSYASRGGLYFIHL